MWSCMDKYEGNWVNGRMCGQGLKTMNSGDSYDGEWKDDQSHGYGIKKFANGDVHSGFYCHDRREGLGEYCWANGDSFDGNWHAGEQHGEGWHKYAEGNVFRGTWVKGKKHGTGGSLLPLRGGVYRELWEHGRMNLHELISGEGSDGEAGANEDDEDDEDESSLFHGSDAGGGNISNNDSFAAEAPRAYASSFDDIGEEIDESSEGDPDDVMTVHESVLDAIAETTNMSLVSETDCPLNLD